jgi:hypothetical protein
MAWQCIALFDPASSTGKGFAAWVAVGMITSAAEAVDADLEIVAMGRDSLSMWPQGLADLPQSQSSIVIPELSCFGIARIWRGTSLPEIARGAQRRCDQPFRGKSAEHSSLC